jgi:signal transduction histidine kinase
VRRLYSRIYVHLVGVLVVVGLAVTVLAAFGQRAALQRHLSERVVRHVGALVEESWDDPAALERRVAQLHRDLGVGLVVRDAQGRAIASAGAAPGALTRKERNRLQEGRVVTRRGARWSVAFPVRGPTGTVPRGFVEVGLSPGVRLRAFWRPGLAVLVVLGVVALAAGPLARRISRPLERLTEAVRRLGAGDLSARVPERGARRGRAADGSRRPGDEIETLTAAFNDMAERLERLVRGQKELLANVSHELRSPLARVRVALALVPREGDAESRLAGVESDLAELERLIDDVLTTSRLEATGLPSRPAPVDVGRLLGELGEQARHDPATARVDVRVDAAEGLALQGDAGLLRRALWNLVENAAKYGAPPVVVAAEEVPGAVLLSVTDAGPGIPAEERARVLEPFYRGDRARTPGAPGESPRGGFGLGLTLARRVAEAHGGEIRVEPAAVEAGRERGCRVVLRIPVAR